MSELTAEAVERLDPGFEALSVSDLPNHLRDALWRVDSASPQPVDADVVVVAGMGGSGIGGQLAVAAYGDRLVKPVVFARGYTLPPWVSERSLVYCASYSGNTEETVAAYDAARALGARRVVCTTGGELAERARADDVPVVPLPGGFQPRAAVGYSFAVAAEMIALAGAGPSLRDELAGAADRCEALVAEWGPSSPEDSRAKALVRALDGRVPVIGGAELTAPVAYRWKTQFNENAKLHAFAHELPELDHNEIVGWRDSRAFGSFAAVLLDDESIHPRTRTRVQLTAELIRDAVDVLEVVSVDGASRTERLAALVLLGDYVSLYAAILRGLDPGEIDVLHELKRRLAG